MGYIYKITNDINDKSYIGLTTTTVEQRWSKHIRNYKTVDYTLYKAMRKYGIEHFSIQTVEQCDNDCLNECEKYYINLYDTYSNGYNDTRGGEGNTLYDRKEIYSLWDDGYSVGCIAKQIGSVRSSIYSVLLDYDKYSPEESLRRRNESLNKRVCQFNINGELLQTFNSIKEADLAVKASRGAIGSCCNRLIGHRTVKGYVWLWEDDKDDINEVICNLKQSRRSIPQMQKVIQYTLDGDIVAVYNTAKEAAMAFGKKKDSHIGDCCKGRRKSIFGYIWKFADDVCIQDGLLNEMDGERCFDEKAI